MVIDSMQRKVDPNVVPFKPRPGELMKAIRTLAKSSANVYFGDHARQRILERGINDEDAIRVLVLGEIRGDIAPGHNVGEWKCKVVARIKGSREIGVVTITLNMSKLFVKTVEWEDP